MIRDITFGQYYPGDSVIHRLDARVKILWTLMYLVMIFFVKDFIGYGIFIVALAGIIKAAKIPFRYIARGMKPIMFILILTFILNMFLHDGKVLVQLGPLEITDVGVQTAVFIAFRLILLIFGTSLLTYTTKPMQLTDGLEKLMSPLAKLGFPANEVAMMISIALRFIPTLLDETDKIMKAQQARGADFETGNVIKRITSMIPLIIPLFVSSFRIAQDLAMAMEARCYRGGTGRTRLHPMKYKKADYVAYTFIVVFAAVIVVQSRGILPLPMLWPR
ncbi:MAG: energy-coupling factor transporter transmembrane protein EcfT [Firmicutes bacterium]|nr:energy-coupling factor transporter transmembrane protein EcfT [Bacillota bacterium]